MAITFASWKRLSFFAPKRRASESKTSSRPSVALDEKDASASATGYSVSETPAATAKLSAEQRAAFAVTSRLLASFVTEALLHAIFLPIHSELCAGLCIILSSNAPPQSAANSVADIFAIVPLHHAPIKREGVDSAVWLVDPLDMLPNVFFFGDGAGEVCEVR